MSSPTLDLAMLERSARDPANVAWQDPTGQLRSGELAAGAFALSKQIAQSTARDTVAICLPSIKEFPLVFFATLLAGKTAVPINFLLQPRELLHVFKDSGAELVITCRHFEDKLKPLGVKTLCIEDLPKPTPPSGKPSPASNPRDVAVLLYTSGTTSLPKGVKLTHANFLAQHESLRQVLDLPRFHMLSALPMFHTFALTVAIVLPAVSEARASLLPRFDPGEVIEALPKFGANTLVAVPSMYRMMTRAAKRAGKDAESLGLTLAIAGGEKLPPDVREEFEAVFKHPLYEGYGLTEHGPVVAVNTPAINKAGSIGKVLPGVEWRIVGTDGKAVAAGEEGELRVRSASVMAGYHNHTESPVDKDGWLATGDLARADKDGFVAITGRIKELIISAGKNIHPSEIEDVVAEHPSVSENAVIGMADKTRGEAPALFVVLHKGAALEPDTLRDWLRERLAEYKMPRLIKILPELPHGPTGKVLKRALKAHVEE